MYSKETLSIVYHDLMADLIHLEVPNEEWLDCNNCHFCSNASLKRFHTKCCDYQASLTNFIAGSILNDSNSDLIRGKQLVRERIENRLGVTPYGILPSHSYNKAFKLSRDKTRIVSQEETTALKCSFYDQGNCTVYKYRSDICGLHFCKSVSIDHGLAFWDKAKKMNRFLDITVALLVAKKMGISMPPFVPEKIKYLSELIETDSGEIDEVKYKALWGEWYGNEEAFYKESQSVFKSFSTQELRKEIGQALEGYEISLRELAVPFHKHRLPEYLIFDEQKWQELNTEKKLHPALLVFLKFFNGKNKTADLVKKAAYIQLQLIKPIQLFWKEGSLVEYKKD